MDLKNIVLNDDIPMTAFERAITIQEYQCVTTLEAVAEAAEDWLQTTSVCTLVVDDTMLVELDLVIAMSKLYAAPC